MKLENLKKSNFKSVTQLISAGPTLHMLLPALLTILFLFTGVTASAENYFFRKVTGISNAEQAQTIQLLLESSIREHGQAVVKAETEAKYIVETRAIALGKGMVVSVTKLESGKSRFSTQLKATEFEEIDRVTQRLARSLLEETTAQSNQEVGESVDEDGRQTTARTKSLNRWAIGIGPMGMSHSPDGGKAAFGFYLGYLFDVNPDWALRLSMETATKDDTRTTSMSFFSIGGTRYFNRKNIAPFVRADFGYGGGSASRNNTDLNYDSKTESGFGLGVGSGYQFFRTSTVGLEVELKYQTIFAKVYDRQISMYGFGVKILF